MPIIRTTKPLNSRDPKDHYPTDPRAARAAILAYGPSDRDRPIRIIDAGAGWGIWGIVARQLYPAAEIIGIDISPPPPELAPGIYNSWQQESYLTATLPDGVDLVMGNPPYKPAERFVRRSLGLLADGGALVFLLRLYFSGSKRRARGLFRTDPPETVATLIGRPSWTWFRNGRTDADEYAIWFWRKGYTGRTYHDWLEWQDQGGWVPPAIPIPPPDSGESAAAAYDLPETILAATAPGSAARQGQLTLF
jgi:hypothetical protein